MEKRIHYVLDNNLLLEEFCIQYGIPDDAWSFQGIFCDEKYYTELQGQLLKKPMYRFRACTSEPNAIVCTVGKWVETHPKGVFDYHKNRKYPYNYQTVIDLIKIERRNGKLVAVFTHSVCNTWEELKTKLEITSEHIPVPKSTPERAAKHKVRIDKIRARQLTPPNSEDESEDSYNS